MTAALQPSLEQAFASQRRDLWGLCYRMTGCAADADDLVQEAFARALSKPPPDLSKPWRPWLTRVTMNLARDHLRRRRRRAYWGSWLPSPIDTGSDVAAAQEARAHPPRNSPGARYDLPESVTLAFLLALETLTPQRRAVLLLRDVFDYSVTEAADALEISQANVKTTLHRARRQMRAYDEERCLPTARLRKRTREALGQLVTKLLTGDVRGVERMLAADARALSDGGGEFHAARKAIVGRAKVVRFFFNLLDQRGTPSEVALRTLNGLPALVVRFEPCDPGQAPQVVIHCALSENGEVRQVLSVLASRKLTGL